MKVEKFLAIILSFLLVFNPMIGPLAWAVEEELGETPTEEQTQEEVPVELESEPAAEEESAIITGDAESLAEVETDVNQNLDCIPGEVETPDGGCSSPEITTECDSDVGIGHDNSAEVEDTAASSATTGDNEIAGASGDALIDTGDATAAADLENEVNTNVALFTDSGAETEAATEQEVSGENEGGSVVIGNTNQAGVSNDVDVLAHTGENQANENEGQATIESGEAVALANLVNLLNINIVSSDFEILFLSFLEGYEGDLDLNEIWQGVIDGDDEGLQIIGQEFASFLIQNSNLAELVNDVDVVAASGDNQANENKGGASIDTGDATAMANVVNFVNFNLFGSDFFLVVINIFGEFLGDLILPRPEKFFSDGGSGSGSVVFENQNQAEVDSAVVAGANTGYNQTNDNEGDSLIKTGDAQSQANALSIVNTNLALSYWFFLIINHLGSWTGRILGWSSPDAVENPGEESTTNFQLQPKVENSGEGVLGLGVGPAGPGGVIRNQNQASVTNNIQVAASTGNNQANKNGNDTEIKTGSAKALANLINFINLNILGGRWFLGLINILGDWDGDIIFAYPEIAVSLTDGVEGITPGETYQYTVSFVNQGYEEASDVSLQLRLPEGVSFLGDSSGLPVEIANGICFWQVGNLDVDQGGSFQIQVMIKSDFSPGEPLSWWSRLVPVAHAAESEITGKVIATASISTPDPESDLSNNSASAETIVYFPAETESTPAEKKETGPDQWSAELEITAWNNVGEFVYPGDTVTFEITIKNKGPASLDDVYLVQSLYNGIPEEDFGRAGFKIGHLDSSQGAKLSFGLKLNSGDVLPGGHYYTIAQAFGQAPNGDEVASNQARTDFDLRLRMIGVSEARAVAKEEEGVLGMVAADCPEPQEDILPYVLLMVLSSLWLVNSGKMKLKKESA